MSNKDKVFIFDTTMRDGEQSPGASMSIEEKIQISRIFDEMGIDIIEAGFPIASPGDFVELWAMPLIHTAKKSIIDILSLFDDHFEFTEDYAQNIINALKYKLN